MSELAAQVVRDLLKRAEVLGSEILAEKNEVSQLIQLK